MKHRNWFWGLLLLFIAVFLIAMQFDAFGEIGTVTILATALLCAIIIHSLFNLNYFGIFAPLAFLYMIYWEPLDLVRISPWLLILVAILLSISFSIIFPHRRKHNHHILCHTNFKQDSIGSSENLDGNNPCVKSSFSSNSKYLHSDSLKNGEFAASFGELSVYFDQATLSPEGAEVFLDCSFGSLVLYIPKTWKVIDKLQATLGNIENKNRFAATAENAPTLTLKGGVRFGEIEINYI